MKNSQLPASPIVLQDGLTYNSHVDTGLTKREYACIKLGIPETGDTELDDLIRKAERKRLAGLAMQGMLSNTMLVAYDEWKWIAENAVKQADELLNQLNDEQN